MTVKNHSEEIHQRAQQFVIALGDVLENLNRRHPEEQSEDRNQIESLLFSDANGPFTNPTVFYQMSKLLKGGNAPTMKELSQSFKLPKATMTRVVDRWVKQGYAERLNDPNDRRLIRIALTDQGQQLHTIIFNYAQKRVDYILSPLTEDEQHTLIQLMKKLVSPKARVSFDELIT